MTFAGALSLAGCSSAPEDAAAGPGTVAALGGSVADTPWPSDVFRSGDRLAVPSLPLDGRPSSIANLVAALNERDGFALLGSTFFPIDGDALADGPIDGIATWVDLTDGDPAYGTKVTGKLFYRAATHQLVALAPYGGALLDRHRYGCFVDEAIVAPSPSMADALAGKGGFASLYAPLVAWLGANGGASRVGAATVFTTGAPSGTTRAMRAALDGTPAPHATVTAALTGAALDDVLGHPTTTRSGLGDPAGVVHDAIGWLVLGTFDAPYFLDAPQDHLGRVHHDANGAPAPSGTTSIPFALALPKDGGSGYADVPVLVFQHGLNAGRTQVAAVANDYAKAGYATIGIDALWHGSRQPGAKDQQHNFTGAAGPDGFADADALGAMVWFFDIGGDDGAAVEALDGRYVADNFRQAVTDLAGEIRLVRDGDLSAIRAADPALASLSLDATHVVYTGESFGSVLGAEELAADPGLEAAVLSVGGAGIFDPIFPDSPYFAGVVAPLLRSAFDSRLDLSNPQVLPPEAQFSLALVEAAIEPGDPSAFAPHIARVPDGPPKSLLMLQAFSDEIIPNQGGELLASLAGATAVTLPTGTQPLRYATLPAASAPLSGNVNGATVAVVNVDPATHGMFTSFVGQRRFAPGFPPIATLSQPEDVDNPTERLHALAVGFADTLRTQGKAVVVSP